MKAIAILGTNGLPGRYGGWDQLMEHLTKLLSSKYHFTVYCSAWSYKKKHKSHNGAKLVYIPLRANGWQSILYDVVSSVHALFFSDTILLLGGGGTVMFPLFRFFGRRVIYHPDGIEWERKKWSKLVRKILYSLEQVGVSWCDDIISDNGEISDYLWKTYSKRSWLIEYGSDHVLFRDLSASIMMTYGIIKGNYAFKVCRIEPENNIDLILSAFANSALKLIIVGNWENSTYGKKLLKEYADSHNIVMLSPIYNQIKLDELRANCGLYIHGHSVGGTNPSLVEAMFLGLNVVAFDVVFNRKTTEESSLYFRDAFELRIIIENYLSNSKSFKDIGRNLRNIALRRYRWSDIVLKYDMIFSKNV
jgi:glycosyltransferase involved in cell wall biosynthesis